MKESGLLLHVCCAPCAAGCVERLIEQGRIDTTTLITHRYTLLEIERAYRLFENREDGVIKVAIRP